MSLTTNSILAIALFACSVDRGESVREEVAAPSNDLVARLSLSPHYSKCVLIEGLPIVSSSKVSNYAILEAAYLIRESIGHRPEILRAMAANRIRFSIMAPAEMTTDLPEHSDLTPREYWNRRARGLGATAARPAVSCGEENLLCLRGDPYSTENILLHEFAHAIHEMGMNTIDATFDRRLQQAFDLAKSEGLWNGTYAMENRMEYWAEGAQSWFDTNRSNDKEHGPIDTRAELKIYDPRLALLLTEVFGDRAWRYVRPDQRAKTHTAEKEAIGLTHLTGFDVNSAPTFRWSEANAHPASAQQLLPLLAPNDAPRASSQDASTNATIVFANQRSHPVVIDWIDAQGGRHRYHTLRPGTDHLQPTFVGHVWVITAETETIGVVVAKPGDGRVEIR